MITEDVIFSIVTKIKFKDEFVNFFPLNGGANNRVYLLNFKNSKLILKHYFKDKNDLRKRLFAEFSFLTYTHQNNISCVPKPIFCDEKLNIGLYSYLDGRKAIPSDVNEKTIKEAIDFYLLLNENKENGKHLPKASEGCFSIQEYLDIIEKRISILLNEPSQEKEAILFIKNDLLSTWQEVKKKTIVDASHLKLSIEESLSLEERCITPSDFGFHNVIVNAEKIYFIDFEYAGWDDPAKTICDFFCQPAIKISEDYLELFSQKIAENFKNPKKCQDRIKLVFPLCQVKWICIMLNIFINIGKKRRDFSNVEEQKQAQLQKGIELLKNLKSKLFNYA
ncbi:MAG: phosphotransferase [Chlamydiae bacterium]|nr:phosphotransferase [Chlamydiota bacterium]